jgi:TolA-binding protein
MAEVTQPTLDYAPPAPQFRQLWQWPLLLLSVGLLAVAGWQLVNPTPAWGVGQKLALGRQLIDNGRHLDAIDQINGTLAASDNLDPTDQAALHLLLAEALDGGQESLGIDNPANRQRIVEQTEEALRLGAQPDAVMLERLADSHHALGNTRAAADAYGRGVVLDPDRAPTLRKKLIDLHLAADEPGPARAVIAEYVADPGVKASGRAWAAGALADLLLDEGDPIAARAELERAGRLSDEPQVRGIVHLKLGEAAYRLNELKNAENELRTARSLLGPGHDLDADACHLLGQIALELGDPATAASFFDVITSDHPQRDLAADANLYRAVADTERGRTNDAVKGFARAVAEVQAKPTRRAFRETATQLVADAGRTMMRQGHNVETVELLALEKDLLDVAGDEPGPAYFARLARTMEQSAETSDAIARTATDPAGRLAAEAAARRARKNAGDALLTYARKLGIGDDAVAQEALRAGVDLYEAANAKPEAAAALELFAAERPKDPLTPEALLRLGNLYGDLGQWQKATDTFRRNRAQYPNSLAAAQSTVPLAKALIRLGRDRHGEAADLLENLLDNDPQLTPDSEAYKQALYELASLHHASGRYTDAVTRLDEFNQRYPDDARATRLTYLKADSYRRHAADLVEELQTTPTQVATDAGPEATRARIAAERDIVEVLEAAQGLYRDVLADYRATPPTEPADRRLQKLSEFYLADCAFDLGDYTTAIELYNAAAYRHQDDPAALGAYVQIVNAHLKLGQPDEAKVVNERAKWLLKRMPPDAFDDNQGVGTLTREQWQRWLEWAGESGMW